MAYVNHFKCISEALRPLTVLYNHDRSPLPDLSIVPKRQSCTHKTLIPHCFLPPAHRNLYYSFCLYEFAYSRYFISGIIFVLLQLTYLLGIIFSRFIHVAAGSRISFLLKAK